MSRRFISALVISALMVALPAQFLGGVCYAAEVAKSPLSSAGLSLELPGLDGKQHRLEEWKGKVILLNFWASWCGACQIEIPTLVYYQERYAKAGFQVVSIGLDTRNHLANVVRSLGINYPVLIVDEEQGSELIGDWGDRAHTLPYSILLDRDGHVVQRWSNILDTEDFEVAILPLLKR